MQREKAKLTDMTDSRQGLKPIPQLIAELNRQLRGWMFYFSLGYPREVFQKIGHHVRNCMIRHLRRRSQRAFRIPEGCTWYRMLANFGLLNPTTVYVNFLRKRAAKVPGNAGCGKPARPV
jgi:RNA-directed DNA polymerase